MSVVLSVALRTNEVQLAGIYTTVCFVVGAFLSASAGYVGMYIATKVVEVYSLIVSWLLILSKGKCANDASLQRWSECWFVRRFQEWGCDGSYCGFVWNSRPLCALPHFWVYGLGGLLPYACFPLGFVTFSFC